MGRIAIDRQIHYNYNTLIRGLYKDLPEEVKVELRSWGKPHGYSGLNVFYQTVFLVALVKTTDFVFVPYEKKEE